MCIRDSLNNALNFYVKCIYDSNNNVTEICPTSKRTWEQYPTNYCIPVIQQLGQKILLFGSGKTRQGYTRALFQKKIFESDSGLILHDTLILKRTSAKYYRVQLYIRLADDSVYFREITYAVNKLTKSKLCVLKTFEFYKKWFALDDWAAQIVDGMIRPKANQILEFRKIKSNYFFNRINITKESFKDMPTIPISLFWLIHSGLMN